jgi:excisionase family DNA binding protein
VQNLLEDYITIEQAAQQPGMPGARTIRRLIARREIPVVYLGRKPLINVPAFREALQAREIKSAGRKR